MTLVTGMTVLGLTVAQAPAAHATSPHGGVVSGADGPAAGVSVDAEVYDADEDWYVWADSTTTGDDGSYAFPDLAPGHYRLDFYDNAGRYASKSVEVDVTATGFSQDVTLEENGTVTGKVTGGGQPVAHTRVEALAQTEEFGWDVVATGSTAADGTYALAVPPGEVKVQFRGDVCESWNDEFGYCEGDYVHTWARQFYGGADNADDATPVVVTGGATTPNINATLTAVGKIAGKVTGSGTALAHTGVELYRWYGAEVGYDWVAETTTGADGTYTLPADPGTYKVGFSGQVCDDWSEEFNECNGNWVNSWLREYYDNKADLDEAETVTVNGGATTQNINADLGEPGTVSGTVQGGGQPLADADVAAYQWVTDDDGGWWKWVDDVVTGPDGSYQLHLAPGQYVIGFFAPCAEDPANGDCVSDFSPVYYNQKTTREAADTVAVAAGSEQTVNANLPKVARITGKVTDNAATPAPLSGITVCTFEHYVDEGSPYWGYNDCTTTHADGTYQFAVPAGTYRIGFSSEDNQYGTAYYKGATTVANVEDASDLAVTAGSTTPNINAKLARNGKITGKVTGGGANLAGIEVIAWTQSGEGGWEDSYYATTGDDGTYAMFLGDGTYRIQFQGSVGDGGAGVWASEYWNNAPTVETATAVTIANHNTVGNVNADLAKNAVVKGAVTSGGQPVADARVVGYVQRDGAWDRAFDAFSGEDGTYELHMPPGTYRVAAQAFDQGYNKVFWQNATTVDAATDVVLTTAQVKTGVDFGLTKVPTPGNDDFAHAAALGASLPATANGTTLGATEQAGEPDLDCGGGTVWYSWTPAAAGNVTVQLSGLASDAAVGIFTGSAVGALTRVDSAYGWNGHDGSVSFPAAAATSYKFLVESCGDPGTFTLGLKAAGALAVQNTDLPEISGLAKVGQTLTATHGDWDPFTGLTYHYQWKASGTNVGTDSSSLLLSAAELGKTITVTVTAAKAGYTSGVATSTATAPVVAANQDPPISNTAKPSITGTLRSGETLMAHPGTWNVSGPTYAYQWKAGGVVVGTNSATLTLTDAQVGKTITVTVTASKAGFSNGSATSDPTAVVAAADGVGPSAACTSAKAQLAAANKTVALWTKKVATYKGQVKKLKKAHKAAKAKLVTKKKLKPAQKKLAAAIAAQKAAAAKVASNC